MSRLEMIVGLSKPAIRDGQEAQSMPCFIQSRHTIGVKNQDSENLIF